MRSLEAAVEGGEWGGGSAGGRKQAGSRNLRTQPQ